MAEPQKPADKPKDPVVICHRMYVGTAIPRPSAINPRQMEIEARINTSACLGAACMMWNPDRSECYDKTQARALSRISDNYSVPHGDQ